jgi:hypothetical protein
MISGPSSGSSKPSVVDGRTAPAPLQQDDLAPWEEWQVLLIAAATIWCWSADLNEHGSWVYSREQCYEIMKQRRAGVCRPSEMLPDREDRLRHRADD